MVDPEDLKMDNDSEFDLDGDFIELTQMVAEDKSLDEDIIELTEPLVAEDKSLDEDIIELTEPLVAEDKSLDEDIIELTEPLVAEDKSFDEDIIELTEPLVVEDKSFDEDMIDLVKPIVDVDETDPIIGVSTGNEDHISEAQIQSVLEKIIEEKYAHRMDELFSDTIHKVVEKEMEKIKNTLLQALTAK